MALKLTIQFPIFAPPPNHHNNHRTPPLHHRPPTEVRFSRWNNANAEPFELKRRHQEQIEHDIRRRRRFDSADNIAATSSGDSSPITTTTTFKSTGTPSSPSKSSIPSKNSKYSKNPNSNSNSHPVFRKKPKVISRGTGRNGDVFKRNADVSNVTVTEDGVSYIVEGAPFELMYSYTETPKVKPIALREPPFSPFGPPTMARPWTGKAPLPGSKKKLRQFDSFVLPPPFKKGVKPVQRPGPFLQGSGPKYAKSREEILGEALTEEEVKGLIKSCMKSDRQLNMGRDGLTHNMLDNIHAHWKRRRVCKIKCKGVCTVDMANVRTQLEEKTGGKIIHSRGGVLFLFRGRNYNYLTRPRYPIMLWKPVTPVYPRLVKQAPEGLTVEEAGIMRKKGRNLIPICKLAKNGVYSELANNVREAFEACELARINCQGLNPSDYRRIGAKLKDLIPCVLISFEHEHILMWRGREWKSSFSDQGGLTVSIAPTLEKQEISESPIPNISVVHTDIEVLDSRTLMNSEIPHEELVNDLSSEDIDPAVKLVGDEYVEEIIESRESFELEELDTVTEGMLLNIPEDSQDTISEPTELSTPCTEGVLLLLKHALENGSACILDGAPLDDDIVYKRVVEFSPSAPAGPVFKYRPRRTKVQKWEKGENIDSNSKQDSTVSEKMAGVKKLEEDIIVKEIIYVPEKRAKKSSRSLKMSDFNGDYPNAVVAKGTLGVDELAKLLS